MRATKIDELPQLLNVIKGDMALVGPRPEAPEIVDRYYTADDIATLQVLPGLTSPGTLYYYTHCEAMLTGDRYGRDVRAAGVAPEAGARSCLHQAGHAVCTMFR